MKFKTLYVDPPWMNQGGGTKGYQQQYPMLSTEEIINIRPFGTPVKELAEDNAHLYLWACNGLIREAFKVMETWDFRYITMITWAKNQISMGQYFRVQTEPCLFGVRGMLPYKNREDGKRAQGSTLLLAPRREHSRKPDEMRDMIEHVSHGPYLELFARETPRNNWTFWGNEVPNEEGTIDVVAYEEAFRATNPRGKGKPWLRKKS